MREKREKITKTGRKTWSRLTRPRGNGVIRQVVGRRSGSEFSETKEQISGGQNMENEVFIKKIELSKEEISENRERTGFLVPSLS